MLARGLLVTALLLPAAANGQDTLKEWIATLDERRDDAKPDLVRKIARDGSREAMEALVKVYDNLRSIYMRREVVRALPAFDGITEAEEPAVEKIANVAVGARAPELREAAIDALGKCEHLGKSFLQKIVQSDADDQVRLMALEKHIERADKGDVAWYRKVWNPKRDLQKSSKGGVAMLEFEPIREVGFAGFAKFGPESEVVDGIRSALNARIRSVGLRALQKRGSPRTAEMAEWMFERVDIPGPERVAAMKVLVEEKGARAVPKFIALAKKKEVTQEDLRQAMAAAICNLDDKGANKKVVSLLGRGKPHMKVFALYATRHLNDAKVLKSIRRSLKDKAPEVRRATAEVLAERKDRPSLPDLHKLLDRGKLPSDKEVAIEAIDAIEGSTGTWVQELAGYCTHDVREVRNAAIDAMSRKRWGKHFEVVEAALDHDDWTTRLAAVCALEAQRRKESVPMLITRLGKESGRMSRLVADALWSLTGMPFGEAAAQWQKWWADDGSKFKVLSQRDLAKADREREIRRLKARTTAKAEFFGIKIESKRVIFVIDTSGSMTAPVHGRFIEGRQANRIEVAKEELKKSIDGLEEGALFNIFSFSLGVGRWLKEGGIALASEKSREEALVFVDRLGAGGPTNLFDTLKMAFQDPDVDTIFVLSDGEPTSGEILDQFRIREEVARWNKHRRVQVHTIAIGGNLDILEWLAEDSGGDHVRIR